MARPFGKSNFVFLRAKVVNFGGKGPHDGFDIGIDDKGACRGNNVGCIER